MYNDLKKLIIIKFNTDEEAREYLPKVHAQLVGNEDYIDNNIILNDHITRLAMDPDDKTIGEVHVYIFNQCINVPELKI